MEIGVVVHGPGIVDSGWAKKIIDILSNFGNVRCRLGGTMGRTAVIDAGLEDIIDISLKLLPSQSLELFNREHVDVIFLLNYGKSPETGRVFGYKVFTHYFKQISNEDYLATNHKPLYESSIPVIQIERPGEEDGSIISWNEELNEQLAKSKKSKKSLFGLGKKDMVESLTFNFEELFDGLKVALDLTEITPEEVVSQYLSNNKEIEEENRIEKLIESYDDYETGHYTYRKIHGVSEGENIFINGIVVGSSKGDSIVLVARDGLIVDIVNANIKYHGLEKLGPVDLERVIVKTGLLRKSDDVNPRVLSKEDISIRDTERNLYSGEISEDDSLFKVAYVDHAAYDIYKFKDFDLVVTVGDDTSLVASDILYRFNIPIIGITDGDLDKVVENGFVNEQSVFIEVASGFDDIVGNYIQEELFELKDTLEVPFDEEANSVEEFKSIMFKVFKASVVEKIANIVPRFVEKDSNFNIINSFHEVVDENPELVENLDEFIDGFEYVRYDDEEEIIFDDSVDELYFDEVQDSPVDDYYEEHDFEDISDAELEEIIVQHVSDDYPSEEEYLENLADDAIFYDEIPYEESQIEEIYVDHSDSSLEEVYVDRSDSSLEEVYVEHDPEELVYEDAPIEEVYIEESVEDIDYYDAEVELDGSVEEGFNVSVDKELNSSAEDELEVSVDKELGSSAEDELDDSDGWAEYIEEEFGDSDEESDDSN